MIRRETIVAEEHQASSSEKTMELQVTGPERKRFLGVCLDKIARWGLVMPMREILLLDFGLGEFERTGLVEFWIANEQEAGYCGKFLFLFDGQTCPAHEHGIKHETFFVVKGRAEMRAGGETTVLNEGDVYAMAPGTTHSFSALGDTLLLEASMPCLLRDNTFEDKRIGDDGVF